MSATLHNKRQREVNGGEIKKDSVPAALVGQDGRCPLRIGREDTESLKRKGDLSLAGRRAVFDIYVARCPRSKKRG
jgi:hypothetical protein